MREAILGKTVTVTIDRPLGSVHPKYPSSTFPVNCGYVSGHMGSDRQPQDAYVLGVSEPLESFTGRVIAIIHRRDSRETRWVVVPLGLRLHQAQIMEQVMFQERHFRSWINALYERSCGMIPYRITERGIEYLLLLQKGSRTWSFPKGHMEPYETERDTAIRELWEETRQTSRMLPGFRETLTYSLGHRRRKTIVLFLGEVRHRSQLQRTEILEGRFVSRETALRLLRHSPYERILDHAEEVIHAMTDTYDHKGGGFR